MGENEPPLISFIGRRLDPRFAIRFIRIPPGSERPLGDADWADALVVVEHGILELEAFRGAQARFGTGDILSLARLPRGALRSSGGGTLLLSTARRRG